MEIKFNCPKCGQEISVSISAENRRMQNLRQAGIDTGAFLALSLDNGHPEPEGTADEDDPVLGRILNSKPIEEKKLFRRWIMSQMFHMLAEKKTTETFLTEKGYDYCWRTLIKEMQVQEKMSADRDSLELRQLWFNRETATAMAEDYLNRLTAYCNKQKSLNRKTVTIGNTRYNIKDLDRELLQPMKEQKDALQNNCTSRALAAFYKQKLQTGRTDIPKTFINAYKGAGAYYTLSNLILYHDCKFMGESLYKATDLLNATSRYLAGKGQGDRMHLLLLEAISDNGIDIEAKMKEWQK